MQRATAQFTVAVFSASRERWPPAAGHCLLLCFCRNPSKAEVLTQHKAGYFRAWKSPSISVLQDQVLDCEWQFSISTLRDEGNEEEDQDLYYSDGEEIEM